MNTLEIIKQIRRVSNEEDIKKIADASIARHREVISREAKKATLDLSVGDEVRIKDEEFKGRRTKVFRLYGKTGKVTKVNNKTVSVDFGNFDKWKVTATMVEKV